MLTTALRELGGHVGEELGASNWIEIPQSRIDAFGEATEDRQWLHVDPDRAKDGPFGGTIAHGYLTLSLVSAFLFELIEVSDAASAVNYGLDRLRFPAPVPAGARVRGHGTLLEVDEVAGGVQAKTLITIECDSAEKPVAIAEVLTRYYAA